ncbi:MAG: T9SS type A sorting domain-containing protein [Bacteroidia bacterium]|nr:T9SS type A sorting domain-containing protein [Bacteroidia bacterium]
MSRLIQLFVFTLITKVTLGQLSPPKTEGLFGGRILDINGYSISADSIMLFVSTESPNSIFKAKIKTTLNDLKIDSFEVLPSLNSSKGFGSSIQSLAFDTINKYLIFSHQNGLFYTTENAEDAKKIENFGTQNIYLKDSILFFFQGNTLKNKKIRLGEFVNSSIPNFNFPGLNQSISMFIHPINHFIYVLVGGPIPMLYKSSDAFYALNSLSNFNPISITGTWPGVIWEAIGIGLDGRIFIGGANAAEKKILFTDNELTWTFINTGVAGRSEKKFSFSGTSSNYNIYFSTASSFNKGINWKPIGNIYFETHPNDGYVFISPIAHNCLFLNTDAGLGASSNFGDSVIDINKGIEALQINGIDMNVSKSGAWIASKAGIRKNTNYQSTQKSWSNAMFPNGDGSPYYTVSMINNDTNRVLVGNIRIYKSNTSGRQWNKVFSPEDAPFNFPSFNLRTSKIAVCSFDTNLILVSYIGQTPNKGGLFYSINAGLNWTQLPIASTSIGQDINIHDISIVKEGNDTIAYLALEKHPTNTLFSGVFRIVKRGSNWLVNPNMDASNTQENNTIIASLDDLELNIGADTLYAAGTDYSSGIAQHFVFYKLLNGIGKWQRMKMAGFQNYQGGNVKIALGKDTLYAAANETLLSYPLQDSIWFRAYKYPKGSSINFLYYDDLLAGTGVGLFGHFGSSINCRPFITNYNPSICNNEFYTLPDSTKIDTSGSFQFLYKNKGGCDSIVTITLIVNRPDVSIFVKSDTLFSNETGASSYQWLDCNNNFAPVAGAQNRIFIPNQSGNYAVKVTKALCIDTSDCFFIQANGIGLINSKSTQVFPNPAKMSIQVNGINQEVCYLEIYDIYGVLKQFEKITPALNPTIVLNNLKDGTYYIRLKSAQDNQNTYYLQNLL